MTTSTQTLVPFAEAVQRYDPVFGLETHVELGTRTKMFCGCPATFGAEPNSQVFPLCLDGYLDVIVDGTTVRVGIERVHLEEDTGKSLHVGGATGRIHGAEYSLVDYNRAGIPLVEIVTKPVPGTGADAPAAARAYVTELRDLIRSLDVSDVRMEQGSLRCDVNVSLNRPGEPWGTRTETKNVNSLRNVERAVRYEMLRQAR